MKVVEDILNWNNLWGIDWFISVWWYWLPVTIGLLFRLSLLKNKICNLSMGIIAILKEIGVVFGLTMAWSYMNSVGLDDNAAVMLVILTMFFIFYIVAENCKDTGGTTESLLLIIRSVFITMLSFQTLCGTIFGAVLTCILATLAYRFWVIVEKKSDLAVIFFCVLKR